MKITGKDETYEGYEIIKDERGMHIKFNNPKFESMNGNCIETDDNNGMYFYIDNPYVESNDMFEKMLTDDNMEQMINSLKDNYCDAFIKGMFGGLMPVRFINRCVGKDIRNQSIEGWKNTQFKFAIKVEAGFSSMFEMDENFMPKKFDSQELAQEYMQDAFDNMYEKFREKYPESFEKKKENYFKQRRIVKTVA